MMSVLPCSSLLHFDNPLSSSRRQPCLRWRRKVGVLPFNRIKTPLHFQPCSSAGMNSSDQPKPSNKNADEGQSTRYAKKDTKPKRPGKLQGLLPSAVAQDLLLDAGRLLQQHLWPIVIIYAAKDSLSFLLHRLSQRLTNAAAESVFGTAIPVAANPWWLYLESSFLESNVGYQACIVTFFLLALPVNILISSLAASNTALICVPDLIKDKGGLPAGMAEVSSSSNTGSSSVSSTSSSTSTSDQRGVSESSESKQTGTADEGKDDVGMSSRRGDGQGSSSPASSSSAAQRQQQQQLEARSDLSAGQGTASQSNRKEGEASQGCVGTQGGKKTEGDATAAQESVLSPLDMSPQGSAAVQGEGTSLDAAGGPWQQEVRDEHQPGLKESMKAGLQEVKACLPAALAMVRRVWLVDLLFNFRALPLQGISLLVLPVFWTVPRLLAIQLAVPTAIVEGRRGSDALSRSSQLMEGFKPSYGWPFVALILAVRFLDGMRNAALSALPPRWWQEVIEVPILLTAVFSFTKLLLIRLQDLIPLAAYIYALKHQGDESSRKRDEMEQHLCASLQ